MTNSIWDQESSSSFSIWSRLLCTEQAHDERTERTHPDFPTISRRTRPLGTVSLGGTVFHWNSPIAPPPTNFKYYQSHSWGGRPQSRGRSARHWLEPVGDRRSVKVYCHQQGWRPQQQVEPEGQKEKRIGQVCRNRRGKVGAFWMEETQERRMET